MPSMFASQRQSELELYVQGCQSRPLLRFIWYATRQFWVEYQVQTRYYYHTQLKATCPNYISRAKSSPIRIQLLINPPPRRVI